MFERTHVRTNNCMSDRINKTTTCSYTELDKELISVYVRIFLAGS